MVIMEEPSQTFFLLIFKTAYMSQRKKVSKLLDIYDKKYQAISSKGLKVYAKPSFNSGIK